LIAQALASGRQPDLVRHEPSAAVCDAEHAMQLVCTHTFFAAYHQPEGQKPFVHGDVRAFQNGANPHRQLLTTLVTPVPTDLPPSGATVSNAPQRGQNGP
jgi:hypothetical protein